jgi:hypothetical protein
MSSKGSSLNGDELRTKESTTRKLFFYNSVMQSAKQTGCFCCCAVITTLPRNPLRMRQLLLATDQDRIYYEV